MKMSSIKNLPAKLFSFIKNRYTLPKEAKEHISRRNIKNALVIVYFLIAFSVGFLIFTLIKNPHKIIFYSYYASMLLGSVIAFVILKLLAKKNNYYAVQTFIIIMLSIFLNLLMFNVLYSSSYGPGLISIYIYFLISIISFDINPLFHTTVIILFAIFFSRYGKMNNIYYPVYANNILYCGCLLILTLYKRSSLVNRNIQRIKIKEQNRQLEANNIELEHQKDSLLMNKKNLEDYALNQSEKLHMQNERLIRIQNNTIVSLSNLVENRDEDTGNHVIRTQAYVELITVKAYLTGQFPELNEETVKLIIKAAPMHDIGKIVVPDSILKKPGKLTPEEFEQIKLHTTKGGEIVESVLGAAEDEQYVKIAKEIATSHHEKYNGTGYPHGLSGTDIPLSARIMAIADVFDALVSPRCYKSPYPIDDAFKIISESAGTHFDPVLAQLFVDSKDQVIKIYDK